MAGKVATKKPAKTTSQRAMTTASTFKKDEDHKQTSDSQADDVQRDLRLLQAILDPPKRTKTVITQAKRPRAQTNASTSKSASARVQERPKSNNGKYTASRGAETSPEDVLPPLEQKKLAMNSLNQSLKVLTAVAKQRQFKKVEKHTTSTRQKGVPKEINGIEASVGNDESLSLETYDDPSPHAIRASMALEVLRKLDCDGHDPKEQKDKREYGAVLLLDKLITLDLSDLAFAEASKIHEQYWKRRKDGERTNKSTSAKIDLATIIQGSESFDNKNDFDMTCLFQSQILRLAIARNESSLTHDFVSIVNPEAHGSPASVISAGQVAGFIDRCKAGDHLRTIGQALTKLSLKVLNLLKNATAEKYGLAISTLAEAQTHEIISWSMLELKSPLENKLWTILERVIRQSWPGLSKEDTERYAITNQALDKVQNQLRKYGFQHELPLKLVELRAQLAELHDDTEQAINAFESLCHRSDAPERPRHLFQLASTQLESKALHGSALKTLNAVTQALNDKNESGGVLLSDRLLAIVRLRKVCSQKLAKFAASEATLNAVENDLHMNCLSLLFAIFRFFANAFQTGSTDDMKTATSLPLAVFKSIEAIADAETFAQSAASRALREYLNIISECVDLIRGSALSEAKFLQHDSQLEVLSLLKIRLSNILWRGHLHSNITTYGQDASLLYAQKSVLCLENLSAEKLSKSALGPRLEKVASLHSGIGQFDQARQTLEKAIHHYISAGALADAVETSLSKRSSIVWSDTAALTHQLGRALRSFNSLSEFKQDPMATVNAYIYDNLELPAIHRAVLLEFQILNMLHKWPQNLCYETLFDRIKEIFELTNSSQYYVWNLRLASGFARCLYKIQDISHQNLTAVIELLVTVSATENDCSNMFLIPYRAGLQTLLRLQIALLSEPTPVSIQLDEFEYLHNLLLGCSDSTALNAAVDDCDSLCCILRAFTAQASAFGNHKVAALCLKTTIHLIAIRSPEQSTALLEYYTKLTQSHIRLHDIASARLSLAAAARFAGTIKSTEDDLIEYHLVSAEFHLVQLASDSCESHLLQASLAYAKRWPKDTALSPAKQIERDGMLAMGVIIASKLAFQHGKLQLANRYARQGAKIAMSIWSALQKRKTSDKKSIEESILSSLAEDISRLNIKAQQDTSNKTPPGAKSWPYIQLYIFSIRQCVQVLLHTGVLEDALHYHKQLQQMVAFLPRLNRFNSPIPMLCATYAKAGQLKMANELLLKFSESSASQDQNGRIEDLLYCAEAFALTGNPTNALSCLQLAPELVEGSVNANVKKDSESKQQTTSSTTCRTIAKPKVVKNSAKRPNSNCTVSSAKSKSHLRDQSPSLNLTLEQLLAEDKRRALNRLLPASDIKEAQSIFLADGISTLCSTPINLVEELYAVACSNLAEAWKILNADALQSVLTDSAVALPSKSAARDRHARVSFLQGVENGGHLDLSKPTNQEPTSGQVEDLKLVANMLQSALTLCHVLLSDRKQFCPTYMIHALVKMETRISLLLTTMNLPFSISSTDLVLKASLPKDDALCRETMVTSAENATRDRASLSIWPEQLNEPISKISAISGYQLDTLPKSWNVVSLTLADDQSELLISKIVSGKPPFLVRIPLRRSNEGDGDEELCFASARNQMRSISENANASSHDVRGMGDKPTRAKWHADREALDLRLQNLLQSIEVIWLGGFRGVFAPQMFDGHQVKQFGKALAQSLSKHLPSRQKTNASKAMIEIHEHILEIFLGLGNPEHDDLDDAIIDLLYFVVDILQFNGEQNAYDEIDWDAILVDVLDALRACHVSTLSEPPRHTILILDKELECFPWECLPCLIDHPVSRMPSLATVFDRINELRMRSDRGDAFVISKDAARGSYVLNPSGDLTSTQTLFAPILGDRENLTSSFTSLINSAPTEGQFSQLLLSSDILFYFGHGSGAQYVRPRTIRSLSRCAVTFLFGCSSAKMTEHGAFESTGMPRAYMLGGAPAAVGCLWDVTDREIDRLALKTLSEWGAIDPDDGRVQESLKRKGRKSKHKNDKKTMKDKGSRQKTIVEAVQEGRDACVLKYLCGAAVVVYGIPVVLE